MNRRSEYEPQRMAAAVVIGGALSALLIVAGLAWLSDPIQFFGWSDAERAHIKAGAGFPPLNIDGDQLHRARHRFGAEPNLALIEDELEALHETARQSNRAQFAADTPEVERANTELLETMRYQANDIVVVTGPRGFQLAAEPLFNNCLAGLEDLLGAVRSGELPLSQALEDPPQDRFYHYRDYCGDLLPVLIDRGIVDDDGHWTRPDGADLVDVLQRYRWVHYLLRGNQHPLHMLLSPEELEVFFRWRIEDDTAFTPDQRHRFLLDGLPFLSSDYPVPLAEARIDASTMDDPDDIRARFDQLVDEHPDEPLYSAVRDNLF